MDRTRTISGELMTCSGPSVGSTIVLGDGPLSLGRSPGCDVPLDDERASSQHARILQERGHHRLVDLDSTNGTFVNNQRVQDILLQSGDLIQIGETIFEYRLTQSSGVVDPVPMSSGEPSPWASHPTLSAPNHYAGPVPHDRALALPSAEAFRGYHGEVPNYGGPTEEAIDYAALLARGKKIFRLLLPFWWLVLLGALLGGVGKMVQYRMEPPPERAVFKVSLNPTAADGISERVAMGLEFFREAKNNFMSRRLIRETYEELGIEADSGLLSVTEKRLLAFWKVGGYQSNVYRGRYINHDPEFAVEFLQVHVENFIEAEIEKALRIVLAEHEFFTKELEHAKERLRLAESRAIEFKARNAVAVTGQTRGAYETLTSLRGRLEALESQIAEEQLELNYERRKLRTVSRFTVIEKTDNNPYQQQIAGLEAKLVEARAAGKGPKHPDVVKLQQNLDEIQALAAGASGNTRKGQRSTINPIYSAAEANVFALESSLAVARQERKRVRTRIEEAQQNLSELPEQESRFEDLEQALVLAQAEYDRILAKLRAAEQQVALERASAEARYDMIRAPELETQDHRAQIQSAGMKGAMMGGAGAFFVAVAYLVYRRRLTFDMLFLPKKRVPAQPQYG